MLGHHAAAGPGPGVLPAPHALPCLPAAAERHGGPAGQPGRPAAPGLLRGGGRGRVGTCRGWGAHKAGADPPRSSPHRPPAGLGRTPAPRGPHRGPRTRPGPPGGRGGGGGARPGGSVAGTRAAPGPAGQRRRTPCPPRAGPAIKAAAAAPVSCRDSGPGPGTGDRGVHTGRTRGSHGLGLCACAAGAAAGPPGEVWPPGGAVARVREGGRSASRCGRLGGRCDLRSLTP